LFRYENAFSLKPEDRYTAGLNRKSSWDTLTDNTVEDISTSSSDTSSEKYVFHCLDRRRDVIPAVVGSRPWMGYDPACGRDNIPAMGGILSHSWMGYYEMRQITSRLFSGYDPGCGQDNIPAVDRILSCLWTR